jgi:hypothetical protein
MDITNVIDELIFKYIGGNVVPVLGCELFNVETYNKGTVNIHEYLIKQVFKKNEEWPNSPKLLSELPLAVPSFDYKSLLGCYKLIKSKNKKLEQLSLIASLKCFKVFLIATVFKEFEYEFEKNNLNEEYEIYKNDAISPHGIGEIDFNNNKRKIIYLFDNLDSERCAINDEELLESIYALSKTPNSTKGNSLLSFLQNKTLLFIGCDFPDWFMRYCIRVLYNKPFEKTPTYIINDHETKLNYQHFFYKNYNIQLVQSSPVSEFVSKFYSLASQREEFINKYPNSQIFISYSSKYDKNIAKELNGYLYGRGIETYFDEESKEIGSHQPKIQAWIANDKTKLLISIISQEMISTIIPGQFNYIKDVEWDAAFSRIKYNRMINKKDNFSVVPYFIDDESNYIDKIPKEINTEFRFGRYHNGFEKLFDEIKKIL